MSDPSETDRERDRERSLSNSLFWRACGQREVSVQTQWIATHLAPIVLLFPLRLELIQLPRLLLRCATRRVLAFCRTRNGAALVLGEHGHKTSLVELLLLLLQTLREDVLALELGEPKQASNDKSVAHGSDGE